MREFESKRISDFRPCLRISFVRLRQNNGDTSANCRIFEPLRFCYFRAVARSTYVAAMGCCGHEQWAEGMPPLPGNRPVSMSYGGYKWKAIDEDGNGYE